MNRARLVISDVVYILVGLAALMAFWPVVTHLLETVASPRLTGNQELLFTTMLPLAVLVILAVIYIEAKEGM